MFQYEIGYILVYTHKKIKGTQVFVSELLLIFNLIFLYSKATQVKLFSERLGVGKYMKYVCLKITKVIKKK